MKFNTYITPVLFLSVMGLMSCEDQFINLTPKSDLTEVNFYKTSKDINKAVLGIYAGYQSRIPRDWIIFEMPSDELYPTGYHNFFGLDDLNNLYFSPDNPHFNDFWKSCYNGIFRSNAVISNYEKPTDYGTEQQKLQYVGEAKFMRALFYFDLVRTFGGVPKVTQSISVEESKALSRSSEEEVYALIIEDLKAAINSLPADMPDGRAGKGAATALLVKVYVYLEQWENAKTYLDKLMSDYDYKLLESYNSLWNEATEDNQEVIFSMQYVADVDGQPLSDDFLPYFGVTGITAHGQENGYPTWSLMRKFKKGDTRKEATVTEYWKSPVSPEGEPAKWYPYVSKFAVPENTPSSSGLDIPVLRYDDVILLGAEIQYNLGNVQQALSLLNKIRERAFHDKNHNYTLNDISSKDAFYDKLLLERELEFAYENERWYDLTRTGRLLETLKSVETAYNPETNKALILNLEPKPYMKHFPIPQPQIDIANEGVLEQNEGY